MSEEKVVKDNNIGLKDDKKVAYYSALVDAWIHTRMERDKSLLSLSAGAIGLLVTLFMTIAVQNHIQVILYCLAFICFTLTILACLTIYRKNSEYLENLIDNNKFKDTFLEWLDKFSYYSFLFGVIFAIAIAVASWIAKK